MPEYSAKGALRDPEVRNHFVYRLFGADGRLLYVGCSIKPADRFREHGAALREATARMKVQGPFNYQTARQIERSAIESEAPLRNYTSALGRQRQQRVRAAYDDLYRSIAQVLGVTRTDAMHLARPVVDRAEMNGAFA